MLLSERGQDVTREAAEEWCKKWASSREKWRKIKSCHTFTRSRVWKPGSWESGGGRGGRAGCGVNSVPGSLSLSQPRRSSWSFWATFSSSDSMAARLSISGSCRYNETKRHIVCKQSYICTNLSCTATALKILGHY